MDFMVRRGSCLLSVAGGILPRGSKELMCRLMKCDFTSWNCLVWSWIEIIFLVCLIIWVFDFQLQPVFKNILKIIYYFKKIKLIILSFFRWFWIIILKIKKNLKQFNLYNNTTPLLLLITNVNSSIINFIIIWIFCLIFVLVVKLMFCLNHILIPFSY